MLYSHLVILILKKNALINAVRIIKDFIKSKIKITKIFMTSRNVPPVMTRKKCFVLSFVMILIFSFEKYFEQIDVDSYDLFFAAWIISLQEFVKKI